MGGTVVIENLFDIPGIGYLLMDSIKSRDYPVIQDACYLLASLLLLIRLLIY